MHGLARPGIPNLPQLQLAAAASSSPCQPGEGHRGLQAAAGVAPPRPPQHVGQGGGAGQPENKPQAVIDQGHQAVDLNGQSGPG